MVESPSNYPVQGSSSVGGSQWTPAQTTTFNQLGDAAWLAYHEFQGASDTIGGETFMQCVNNLVSFLNANTPPSGSAAAQIQTDLNDTTLGYSIADKCAEYTTNPGEAFQWISAELSSTTMQTLGSDLHNLPNITNDNTSDPAMLAVKNDMLQLLSDLEQYNKLGSNPSSATLAADLKAIATDITQLNQAASAAGVTDGFLTSLLTYIDSPTFGGSTDTLLSLSAAVVADKTNPPNPNLDPYAALNSVLANMGEQSYSGGNFSTFVSDSIGYEYDARQD